VAIDKILSSETLDLAGSGTTKLTHKVTAPNSPGQWKIRAEAWFQAGSQWSHSPEEWFHSLSIQVIPEFEIFASSVVLIMTIAVFVFSLKKRRIGIRRAENGRE
jgi:hypothetical protein